MGLTPRQPFGFQVKRAGMRFDLELDEGNDLDWALLFWGRHEATSSEWVRRTVRQGWTCLDVGANVGYFTVMLGQLTGPTGRVRHSSRARRFAGVSRPTSGSTGSPTSRPRASGYLITRRSRPST